MDSAVVEAGAVDRVAVVVAKKRRTEAMMMRLSCIVLISGFVQLVAQTNGSPTFSTPEEARDALVQTATKGLESLKAFFGPGSDEVLRTGDPVEDKNILDRFNARVAEKTSLQRDEMNIHRITLLVGADEWPFAIPLMQKNGRWYFDLLEGRAEIRRRIIGGNELDVIQICRGYVEAQELYAESDWNGNTVKEYARKIISTRERRMACIGRVRTVP